MAHYKKFNRAACGHMFKHFERAKDGNGEYIKFSNQNIDPNKTYQNYNLAPLHNDGQGGFVKKRCSEVKMQNRADVNVMCSWVVTAPKEVKSEDYEKFFSETYKFLSERYGKDNVVSAYVHVDEVTPHMHFAFVPVTADKKKNILKVSAKEAVSRRDLQTFHDDLSEHMARVFGRDIGVLNDATRDGNKSIDELKRGTAKKELDEIKQRTVDMQKYSENKAQELRESNRRVNILENKKRAVESEIDALETIFKGKQMTAEKLERIKPEKDFFGNLKNITLEDVENLKKMAITASKYKAALSNTTEDLNKLKVENESLKKKIPTMKERIEKVEKESALINENKNLQDKIWRMDECQKICG